MMTAQAPIPLTVFQSNLQWFGLKCAEPITIKFDTCHNTVTIMTYALWSAKYIMNKSITKFHSILNSNQISLEGRVPGQMTSISLNKLIG